MIIGGEFSMYGRVMVCDMDRRFVCWGKVTAIEGKFMVIEPDREIADDCEYQFIPVREG